MVKFQVFTKVVILEQWQNYKVNVDLNIRENYLFSLNWTFKAIIINNIDNVLMSYFIKNYKFVLNKKQKIIYV